MQTQDYNASRFSLEVQGLATDAFSIQSFSSNNYGLFSCYEFSVQATSKSEIDAMQILGQPTKLILEWQDKPITIYGMVTGCEQKQPDPRHSQFAYEITFKAPLYGLSLSDHNRIYTKKTVLDIVKDIIAKANLPGFQYQIQTQRSYPELNFVMQMNETDLDFLERMLSTYGLFYMTIDKNGAPQLLITDDIKQLEEFTNSSINYHEGQGYSRDEDSIFSINAVSQVATNSIKLKNYNYQEPTDPLEAEPQNTTKTATGKGEAYIYGHNYQDKTAGQLLATVRQQALEWQRETCVCTTDCPGLQPGQLFELQNNPSTKLRAGPDYNSQYRIVNAKITADQSSAQQQGSDDTGSELTYQAELTLIKADVVYKAEPQPPKAFHHILPAVIDSPGGEYASLDKDGCYLVKFPFDDNNSTCRLRQIQPYGGPKKQDPTGMHFPLRADTQVAVGFLDGDLNQPLILGALNDTTKPSPVTSSNKTQHIIKTSAGHQLMFEDQAGKQAITLSNKDDANKLLLDATTNKNNISLSSKGKIKAYANKDLDIKNAKNNITKSKQDTTIQVDGNKNLLTKNKAITHKAGQDVLIKAKDNLTTNTVNSNTIKAQSDVLLQAEQNMQFHSNKDINLQSSANTTISGTQVNLSGGNDGGVQLGGPGFGISVQGGAVSLNGPTITFNCGAINVPTSPVPAAPATTPAPSQVPALQQPKPQKKKQEDEKSSSDDGKQDSGQGDKNQDQGDNNSDGGDSNDNNSDQNDNQADDRDADKNQKNMFPQAEIEINGLTSTLAPRAFRATGAEYIITATNELNASIKVGNKNSVNPVTFDQSGFEIEAKNEALKVYSKFGMEDVSTILVKQHALMIGNEYGDYSFSLAPTLTSNPNVQQYVGSISKKTTVDDGEWLLDGTLSMNLTVTVSKEQDENSLWKNLEYDLQYSLDEIKNALAMLGKQTELIFVNPPSAKEVVLAVLVTLAGAAMVVGSPAGV